MQFKLCPECDEQYDQDESHYCPKCGWEPEEVAHPEPLSDDYVRGSSDRLHEIIDYLEEKIETCDEAEQALDSLDLMCDEVFIRISARRAAYQSILNDYTGEST